ncbi:MAG: PIG-L family deacetylase [Bacteroidetes bacterium QS_9_68_14]|nr:MAG: PIG-L family deacetylase [Bacteroidetes bacterium QS_9_68_14]
MPHTLFLSPHLDDVAFSCGGALFALLAQGGDATVATVFTASVAEPTGFALRCQTDKGLAPSVDYMRLRRAEDEAFAEALRAALPPGAGRLRLRHGPFEEAPHRGYESPEALFAGVRPSDDVGPSVRTWLASLLGETDAPLLFAPQALGGHVDHVHVARAARALLQDAGEAPPGAWYRDLPYALREPEATPCRWVPERAEERAVPLSEAAREAKQRGAAAYSSQLGFQFGGEKSMRETLARFAREEGARLGAGGPAEAVRCDRTAERARREAPLMQSLTQG